MCLSVAPFLLSEVPPKPQKQQTTDEDDNKEGSGNKEGSDNNAAYEDAMDNFHMRFILNLPDEELQSAPRIFF
jgi:hypothetical protein